MRKRTRLEDESPKIDATSELDLSFTDTSADSDSEFEPEVWHHRRADDCNITAKVPMNIFDGNVSIIATANDISRNVLQKVTGAIL